MTKYAILLGSLIVLYYCVSCRKDTTTEDVSHVISESQSTTVKKLMFLVSLKTKDSTYIVTDQIKNLNIKIDQLSWGRFHSQKVDTTNFESFIYKGFCVSASRPYYLFVADYNPSYGNLTTAGEWSTYLNSLLELSPGDYICELAELPVYKQNSDSIVVKPNIYRHFNVPANVSSVYLGEFLIELNF